MDYYRSHGVLSYITQSLILGIVPVTVNIEIIITYITFTTIPTCCIGECQPFFVSLFTYSRINYMPVNIIILSLDSKINFVSSWWVSEWLLLNNTWAVIFSYHGENKIRFDDMMIRRYVTKVGHIFLIPSQPVLALNS